MSNIFTRKYGRAAALVASGLVAGGVLAGAMSANAADTTGSSTGSSSSRYSTSAAASNPNPGDQSKPQRSDEQLLTGATAQSVTDAVTAKYPGATFVRVETDSDGVYEAHITKADGTSTIVQLDANYAITGEDAGGGPGGGHGHGGRTNDNDADDAPAASSSTTTQSS